MKLAALAFAVLLSGCATGSHVLLGESRTPVNPADVKLYLSPPENFEVIALVRSASVTGWTQQQDTDQAIAKLKEEAAKLGANGVLLSGSREGSTASSGVGFSSTGQTATYFGGFSSQAEMTGRAIFVIQE